MAGVDLPIDLAAGDVYRLVARRDAGAVDDAGVAHAPVLEWSASGTARTL